MRHPVLAVFVLAAASCHAREKVVADERGDAGIMSTTPSAGSRPSPSAPKAGDGGTCQSDAECASGLHCLFETAGCSERGQCKASGLSARNCYIAVAMCSCRDRRTFYGAGGCAGSAGEPWELYACPCASDADCRAGQRCFNVGAKPHRADATKECRDPREAKGP
jgi:hypothetical protein